MNTAHTPTPWNAAHRICDDGMYRTQIYSDEHGLIANLAWAPRPLGNGVTTSARESNARRIIACVNACAGISTEQLEKDIAVGGEKAIYECHEATTAAAIKVGGELLAALKRLLRVVDAHGGFDQDDEGASAQARAVIAKAEAA